MTTEAARVDSPAALRIRLAALSVGQVVSWGVLYHGLIVAGPQLAAETGRSRS